MFRKTCYRWQGLRFSVLFLTFFCTVFVAAPGEQQVYAWTCTSTAQLCVPFEKAVQDAAGDLTAGKLYNNLTPVVPENKNLIWKDGVVGSKVLVAAYKYGTSQNPPFSTCQPGVPFPKDCTLGGSAWVTVVPELFDFFKTTPFSTLRIEQLLGLPPNYGNNYIVEYWADPKDLFRPAPDPQIVYQEGTLRFPWATSHLLSVNTDNNYKVWDDYCPNVTGACACTKDAQYMDYQCWFNNRRAWVYSYDLSGPPYPWSGLGYTYDWGNPLSTVGLSEFVLNKAPVYQPFTVTIQSVTVAGDYFKPTTSIPLSTGWNLISVPIQPTDTAIATVLNGILGQLLNSMGIHEWSMETL